MYASWAYQHAQTKANVEIYNVHKIKVSSLLSKISLANSTQNINLNFEGWCEK